MFRDENSSIHSFHVPSRFQPGPSTNTTPEDYIEELYGTLPLVANSPSDTPASTNMSPTDTRALASLIKLKDSLMVSLADKGLAIVVADTEHYVVEALVHLSDTKT